MNTDNLLKLLFELPLSNVKDYGYIVSLGDVFEACATRGVYNRNLVVAWLKVLESDNSISLVRVKDPGFEEVVIGLIIPESAQCLIYQAMTL
ncbi:hypothetical protein P4H66_06210 [Paenibacillus dokdonensis]|uniref:Uncharacterized protein n=1 Tax=Paenibacillus dokdonensis TaxID=2567944 RepID=A0ABU6GIB4_9BACL|nr:hypothetical protein [Paenibacillus dokdonensis]MEC0239448.1 hypothetical protein [Paenibacillus dokdonensis]